MKKTLIVAAALAVTGTASAAPFVWPAAWSATPPAQAQTGGTFRQSRFGEETTLNPFFSRVSPSTVNDIEAAGLFTYDVAKNEYVPYMAESYTLSADKRVFTLKLREGMKWSDGRPIVADDFVVTARINLDEKFETEYNDTYILNDKPIQVTKVDNTTIRVTLPSVTAQAFYRLAILQAYPAHIFGPASAQGPAALKALWPLSAGANVVVSSGPFKFVSYRAGERVTLAKNAFYGEWNKDSAGKAVPYLDGVTTSIFRDANAEFAAFLAGQIDSFAPRSADDLAQLTRAVQANQLQAVIRPNVSSAATGDRIAFNWNLASNPFKQALFRNVDFRRAMAHLANRAAMVQIGLGGLGQPFHSMVYPVLEQFQSPTQKRYEFNLEAATQLLARVGFTRKNAQGILVDAQNRPLAFDLSPNAGNARRAAIAQVFSDEAKKIGVQVNVRPVDSGTWLEILNSEGPDRKFDAVIYGIVGGDRTLPYSNAIIGCEGSLTAWNKSGSCIQPWETQTQALYNRAERELDNAKRRALIFQIQDIETGNQANMYTIAPNQHFAWNARVKGEFPQPLQNALNGSRVIELTWIQQ